MVDRVTQFLHVSFLVKYIMELGIKPIYLIGGRTPQEGEHC
jgi:hypothetical protein